MLIFRGVQPGLFQIKWYTKDTPPGKGIGISSKNRKANFTSCCVKGRRKSPEVAEVLVTRLTWQCERKWSNLAVLRVAPFADVFATWGCFFLCRRMFRLSMVIQYHRKKCGGFALGFRGDVVGYPASSLGRRFCPHTFLLVSRTGPCSLWKVIFKLYITATLVQSLGYSPETRKCVWNPSICPFVTSTPISFSTAYISHRKGPFTHSIIESWINSGVRI